MVIWRLSGCFCDDIKVVIRRLIQMTSFGRLWGVRFWHQFDNPKVVHLTTLFFEWTATYSLEQNRLKHTGCLLYLHTTPTLTHKTTMLYTHKTTLYAHIAAVYPHKNDVIYTNTQGCILHLHKASPNIFTQRRHKHTGTSFICQHNASLYSCHNDALSIQRRTPFTHDTIYIKHSTALYTQNNDAVYTQNDVLCTQRRPIH